MWPGKLQGRQAEGNDDFKDQTRLQQSGGGQKPQTVSGYDRERCQGKNRKIYAEEQLLLEDAKLGLQKVARQKDHDRTHQNEDRQPVQARRGLPQQFCRNPAENLGLGRTWRIITNWANDWHSFSD
jgi:hypothetical protein